MHKAKVNTSEEKNVEWNGETVLVDGKELSPDILLLHDGSYSILLNGKSYQCEIIEVNTEEKNVVLKIDNNRHEVSLKDKFDLLLAEMGMDNLLSAKINNIKAPMPGLVLKNLVKVGDVVSKGDGLLVLEAMKMENVIKSPADGVVKTVSTNVNDAVDKNDILIEFE